MKPIITFIVLSLYLSTITAQVANLAGNWITAQNTIATSCCIPSGITFTAINSSNNTYEGSFSFPSNYVSTNTYCTSNNITGNFQTEFYLEINPLVPDITISSFFNAAETITITSGSTSGIQDTVVGLIYDPCLFSITKIGVKLAVSSVFGIISLIIINLL